MSTEERFKRYMEQNNNTNSTVKFDSPNYTNSFSGFLWDEIDRLNKEINELKTKKSPDPSLS